MTLATPTPLLPAKLTPPPLRAGLVPRARLEQRLNSAARLLVIIAPPGFGKTTLLAGWIAGRIKAEGGRMKSGTELARLYPSSFILHPSSIAWLSLDERDNDPTRFWLHLIAAVEGAAPGVGDHGRAMLQSPTPPPLEVVVGALLEELGHTELLIALDDYQVISAQAIHESMAFLIDNLPPDMRLAVASRSEPPLPLARLRMRGQLVELRAADLRFTADEATQLLQAEGLDLLPEQVAALEARTEGWAGALHMAALSLREAPDTSALIAGFTGSNRHVVDYLADEVLRRQPPATQAFLLATSILDQLRAELCDALADGGQWTVDGEGQPGVPGLPSTVLLEDLERQGLFLIPLDTERRWYRYQSLFAEFLRERLRRESPVRLAKLHRRAAAWYAAAGMPVEAVGHLLHAGDTERAADLIEQEGRPLLLRSEVATVLHWLGALPHGLVQARPALCLIEAWARAVAGQFSAAEAPLAVVEATLDAYPGDPNLPAPFSAPYTPRNLRSEALAVRATVAGLRRETARAVELARQSLAALPDDSVIVRGVVSLILGNSAYLEGDLPSAVPALEAAALAGEGAGMPMIAIFALRQLGEVHGRAGQLHRAAATYQRAIDLGAGLYPRREQGTRPVPVAGAAYIPLGLLHYEWNQLDQAAALLTDGIELGRQGENVEILLMGPIGMARVQWARGDLTGARETIQRAVAYARATGVPRLHNWLSAEQARLALIMGDVAAAAAWDQERRLDPAGPLSYLEEIDFLALAHLRIAQMQLPVALRLLGRLRDLATQQGRGGSLVEIFSLDALAHRAGGDLAGARAALLKALDLGAPEGYLRTFIDLGEPMARLLAELAASKERHAAYARNLLEIYNSGTAPGPAQTQVRHTVVEALEEQPTARELEVLGWIADGLTNEQIADKLIVGLSTVKKHINNLYAKLGVATRTQALKRARELGLIP